MAEEHIDDEEEAILPPGSPGWVIRPEPLKPELFTERNASGFLCKVLEASDTEAFNIDMIVHSRPGPQDMQYILYKEGRKRPEIRNVKANVEGNGIYIASNCRLEIIDPAHSEGVEIYLVGTQFFFGYSDR